ncbi:MAG: hypothetical protein ACOH2E_07495 [Candidatus Paracaedibacter sp.]
MLNKFIPIIIILILNLGTQAEESQVNPKCPDDPTEFKGKEDDCFDCLTGALTKLREFTTEVDKMLDDKKLTTAEEAESLKTRSEGLWDGVAGWQKICEPNVESKEKPEGEETSKTENEAEGESDANAEEANTEGESEPKAEEGDAKAETDTEVKPESETGPERAAEEPEAETDAEPEPEADKRTEAETETEAEPEADA